MKKKLFAIMAAAAVLLMGLAFAGCASSTSGEDTGAGSAGGSEKAEEAPKYSIEGEEMVDQGYGTYYINGTLTNNSGKDVDYIQVEYVLKDADGAQIGTGMANTNNLADGGVWKYEAVCFVSGDDAPAAYELVKVTGF